MKKTDLRRLTTEQPNRSSRNLDLRSALEIARIMNREDNKVPAAVKRALPVLGPGTRAVVIGAGGLGHIGIQCLKAMTATEIIVIDPSEKALALAGEVGADHTVQVDVVVGIAASGRTPYTIGALDYARKRGAKTVALTSNHQTPLGEVADIAIVVAVGPEVLSGSTRMKAGTAQKMVLNMLSTGAMARLGYIYGNQMAHVNPKNEKLRERGLGIIEALAHVNRQQAERALKNSGNIVPVALVALLAKVDPKIAQQHLQAAAGNVRRAIASAQESGK